MIERIGLLAINAIARSAPCRVETLAYGDDKRQRLDWYRLPGNDLRPTVIFFYGGNWRSGRRRDYRFVADTLATFGYDVVVPDYRLFPSVRFDAILEDATLAARQALAHIDSKSPVFVMGHSAGAQISALLTLNENLLENRTRIKAMVGLAGPYRLLSLYRR
ncbi:MAG: alpha/beta hydrolase [Gammaproteobacteria bacterium]|nr:alpha/beta hydrolase [Gammaproteobacteria bacterium]